MHTGNSSPFDLGQLAELSAGDVDFEREILEDFIASAMERLDRIRIDTAAGDWSSLARDAHGLKGTALTVGATALADGALALEAAARQGDGSRARACLDLVEARWTEATAWIKARLAQAA